MMKPTYNINGKERRQLKKELSEHKRFIQNIWVCHQMDKDMCYFFSCDERKLMTDDDITKIIDENNKKIRFIEEQLSVLY